MILRKYEMSGAWQAQVIVAGQILDLKISKSAAVERLSSQTTGWLDRLQDKVQSGCEGE